MLTRLSKREAVGVVGEVSRGAMITEGRAVHTSGTCFYFHSVVVKDGVPLDVPVCPLCGNAFQQVCYFAGDQQITFDIYREPEL